MKNDQIYWLKGGKRLDCADVENQLSSYLDGELCDTERSRLEHHISECEICQELLSDFNSILAVAKELALQPMPVGVAQRLRQRLENEFNEKFTYPKPRLTVVDASE